MIRSLLLPILFFGLSAHAADKNKADDFKGKYLTISTPSPDKSYFGHSKCFKLNPAAAKALESYDSCETTQKSGGYVIGKCERKDSATAYFFDSKKECESYLTETDGL